MTADVLAKCPCFEMDDRRALMGRDLIRAAWVLGGISMYQLSVSFCGTGILKRVYPQWKERLEYKLNRRLYRIMLDADCRKYNDEAYFHGYRRAAVYTDENGRNAGIFTGSCSAVFLAGAVAVVIYIRMDQMIVVFLFCWRLWQAVSVSKVWWKKTQSPG